MKSIHRRYIFTFKAQKIYVHDIWATKKTNKNNRLSVPVAFVVVGWQTPVSHSNTQTVENGRWSVQATILLIVFASGAITPSSGGLWPQPELRTRWRRDSKKTKILRSRKQLDFATSLWLFQSPSQSTQQQRQCQTFFLSLFFLKWSVGVKIKTKQKKLKGRSNSESLLSLNQ